MLWKSIRYISLSFKTVRKSIRHSLDSNGTSDENSHAKGLYLNEIEFHANHNV